MKHRVIRTLKLTSVCFGLCILSSCSAQRNTVVSRAVQNLTARYNYLYNAGVILNEEKQILEDNHTSNTTERLDQVIYKASKVISEKRHSKHIPEAYLLLAEAHYLKGNYFLSEEYFKYVSKTYGSDVVLYVKGLDGSARSLMQSKKQTEAAPLLDSIPSAAAAEQFELKDPEETANTDDLPKQKVREHEMTSDEKAEKEDLLGKNFNTVAGKYRKSKYFTYVQQPPSLEITLQQVLPETPLKDLPLPAENDYNPVTAAKKPATPDNIFNRTPSNSYYFVIMVNDASINLSSSRFGIGEFNRGSFAGQGLKHRLTEFDNDQLIYIGNFSNFETVKKYADGIRPQLQQIMKVPAKSHQSFISSRENFEKINSKDYLNKYIEFYKNNF